ncbi:MAG: DNA glycosylase [Candidatus Woesearchaeota archaeon]
MQKIKINNFNLQHTLECGQLFRYTKQNDFYFLVIRDKILKIKQENSILYFKGASKKFIKNYFRLEEDYERIINELKKDVKLSLAIKEYEGLRICRQDPWECLVSYICSSASNIPKIKNNVENLAKNFGNEIKLEDFKTYSFPEPSDITDLCKIKKCGCGFRSKYIFKTAKTVTNEWLESLRNISYQEAKKELMKLPGVGDKVADCVLLFSLGFDEAFPIDVWIKRIMERLYFKGKKTSKKTIREFAVKRFGNNCGYAQEFLFYYGRKNEKYR